MVDFNSKLSPSNDPSYIGASQAPSRFDFRNEALGTLFQGIGDAVDKTASAADQTINKSISDDVYGSVDPLRNSKGVDTATDAAGTGQPLNLDKTQAGAGTGNPLELNKPPNPQDFTGQISKLKAAYDAGKISDSYYYAQLESATRAIRAKYPGYREQVDQTIQQVTGVVPANALRKAIQSDLDSAKSQSDAAANRWDTFEKQHLGDLPPDYFQRKAQGNPYGQLQTEEYVRQKVAEDSSVARERSRIALLQDQHTLSVQDAENTATKELNLQTQRMMNDATMVSGGLQGLQDKIVSLVKSGRNITPEETQQLQSAFSQLQAVHQNAVDKTLNTPFGKNGESWSSILGPEKTQKVREAALQKVDAVRQMLVDKDFGALLINQNAQKAMQDSDARSVLEKYPVIRNLTTLSSLPGMKDYMTAQIARGDNPVLNDTLKAVNQVLQTNRQANGSDVSQDFKTLSDFQKQKGGGNAAKSYFNGLVEDLQNPAAPKEVTGNTAKSLFNEQNKYFLQSFKPEERADIFTRLVSPQVTQRIQSLGDKDLWNNYSTWAKNGFFNVFKQAGDEIKDSVNREWYDVRFDDKSNQFELVPTEAGLRMASKDSRSVGMNPLNALERQFNGNLSAQVDKINRGIKAIEPILKADGYDPGTEMGKLLRNAGINPQGKEDTFFGKLRRGVDAVIGDPWGKSGTPDTNVFGGSNINFTKPQGQGFGVLSLKDSQAMVSAVNQGQDPSTVALKYLNLDEHEGNGTLRAFFKGSMGKDVNPESTPWCAAFANAVLQSTGRPGTGSLMARSFLTYGSPTNEPQKGDLVVLSRGSDGVHGHVGFFDGKNADGSIRILAGNQSNKVSYGNFPEARVLGYRRPPPAAEMKEFVQEHGLIQ